MMILVLLLSYCTAKLPYLNLLTVMDSSINTFIENILGKKYSLLLFDFYCFNLFHGLVRSNGSVSQERGFCHSEERHVKHGRRVQHGHRSERFG